MTDITGNTYGILTVIENVHGTAKWKCECQCGNIVYVSAGNIKTGRKKSCGCLMSKGDLTRNPLYDSYKNAQRRCNVVGDKNNRTYKSYGLRGIKFLYSDFSEFCDDLQSTWFPGASLERIDVDGDYCVGNCKWILLKEQQKNKTTTRYITFNGVTKCLADWARDINVEYHILLRRIKQHGVEKALEAGNNSMSKTLTIGGETKTYIEWSNISGIRTDTLYSRVNSGTPEDKILAKHNLKERIIEFNGEALTLAEWATRKGVHKATLARNIKLHGIEWTLSHQFHDKPSNVIENNNDVH